LGVGWLLPTVLALANVHSGVLVSGLGGHIEASKPDIVIKHAFSVTNLTFGSVHISTAGSCGCTVPENSDILLSPLSRAVIVTDIDSSGLASGIQRKSLTVWVRSHGKLWSETAPLDFTVK
jgi:hypothetical protein